MVPNISRNGRSFRGAGAYHLYDKPTDSFPRPRTSTRVLFTATRNLANDDPTAALVEMARTAKDAAFLKSAAGAAARGRKNDTPVKTISLAWAPGQMPGTAAMLAAADGFLHAMGWQQHQAVYVAHSDTAHPHLHIILNRVHPETGRTLNDWQERKRAQQWAFDYESATGDVVCQARTPINSRTKRPASAGLPYRQARLLASHRSVERQALARAQRARARAAWARHHRRAQRERGILGSHRSPVRRHAFALAREGGYELAQQLLSSFADRCRSTDRKLASARAATAKFQAARLEIRLNRSTNPCVANDNARPGIGKTAAAPFGPREKAPPQADAQMRGIIPDHLAERRQLLSAHRTASAALCVSRAMQAAVSLAKREVEIDFATRWAAIERLDRTLRPAAIAALKAEQGAALASRTAFHVARLNSDARHRRLALQAAQQSERRLLAARQQLATDGIRSMRIRLAKNTPRSISARPER